MNRRPFPRTHGFRSCWARAIITDGIEGHSIVYVTLSGEFVMIGSGDGIRIRYRHDRHGD